MAGLGESSGEGGPGILPDHAQQAAQGEGGLLAATLLEGDHVVRGLGQGLDDGRFIRARFGSPRSLAARVDVLFQGATLAGPVDDALMGDAFPQPVVDLDAVLGLTDFYLPADPVRGARVAVRVERDVALHVHDALVEAVDLGTQRGRGLRWGRSKA